MASGPTASPSSGHLLEIQSLEPYLKLAKTETLRVKTTVPKTVLGRKNLRSVFSFLFFFLSIVNGNHLYKCELLTLFKNTMKNVLTTWFKLKRNSYKTIEI